MRACTAVIIELRYRPQVEGQSRYLGQIEFLEPDEWHKELRHLYEDCKNPETGKILKKPDPRSQAGMAMAKLRVKFSLFFKN